MTPERLIVAAFRSGLDLSSIFQARPPPERLRPELRPLSHGRESRARALEMTYSADFAGACAGMDPNAWRILSYTILPGERDRAALKAALLVRAVDLAERGDWPRKMRRRDCGCGRAAREHYLEDLCALALLEWTHREAFRTQEARALWFGVTREYWSAVVEARFRPVADQLEHWYAMALGHLWRALADSVHTPES